MRRGIKITLTALAAGGAVILGTLLFMKYVSGQLWEQSVGNIYALTGQGGDALDIQLRQNQQHLESIAGYVQQYEITQTREVIKGLEGFSAGGGDIFLYVPDHGTTWDQSGIDRTAVEMIESHPDESGIVAPHISSETGVQVFDMFQKTQMLDGTSVYIIKEYLVREIADQFTLSFYKNAGFSYIVSRDGEVQIRPSHPNSNKTVRNLFDMIKDHNDSDKVELLKASFLEQKTGFAVFWFGKEEMTLCYTPLRENTGWYLVSIIPVSVITAQTRDILVRTVVLLVFVVLCIVLLALVYLRSAKKARQTIENHANFITMLYHSIPEAICQITVSRPFCIVRLNPEGKRLLRCGGDEEELDGRSVQMEMFIHPDDWEAQKEILSRAGKDGGRHSFSCRIRGGEDSWRWVGGLVEKARDTDGNEILISTFHDITAVMQQEAAKEQERSLERSVLISAVSSMYPLIAGCNLDRDQYQVLYQTDDNLLSIPGEHTYSEIAGMIGENAHPDDRQLFYDRFGYEAVRENRDENGTYMDGRFLLSDLKYHWVSLQMIPVQTDVSKERISIIMVRCIDEQKYEEQQRLDALQSALDSANAANHAKSDFLSRMSHDIRTPMNAIMGMTAIAQNYIGNQDKVKYCLSRIADSSAHLLSLINDVLDMSRIESGKIVLHNEPFSLGKEMESLVAMIRPQAEAKGLVLEERLAGLCHDEVIGDSLRLSQIFLNIAGNAVKFTPAGGRIMIAVEELAGGLRDYGTYQFVCSDTGPGMSEEFLKKIFDPFEREHAGPALKEEGTGLGMSITKNIVDLMNGSIHVESRPGEGSTFTVVLHFRVRDRGSEDGNGGSDEVCKSEECDRRERQGKVETDQTEEDGSRAEEDGSRAEEDGSRAESEGSPSAPNTLRGGNGRRVLLAEDNELNREIAAELLSIYGLSVEAACDGDEAVEMMAASEDGYYSMIITDIQMPHMDGYQAARLIRKLKRADAGTIPIIAMTANAFSDDVERVKEAGMNGHIAKPVDTLVLYKTLDRWFKA